MVPKFEAEQVKRALRQVLAQLQADQPQPDVHGLLDLLGRSGQVLDAAPCTEAARERLQELRRRLLHPGLYWLLSERRGAAILIQQCLEELEPPWSGPDWEEQEPLVRRLLLYMRGKAEVGL